MSVYTIRDLPPNVIKRLKKYALSRDMTMAEAVTIILDEAEEYEEKKKYSLDDIEKMMFSSGDKDLSKKIDFIVYGEEK